MSKSPAVSFRPVPTPSAFARARVGLADDRTALRDAMCRGKPGKTDEYRVAVSATCVAVKGAAKAAADAEARARQKRQGGTPLTATQNRAELKKLDAALAVYGKDALVQRDVGKNILSTGIAMAARMMEPGLRRQYPDPVARFHMLAARLRYEKNAVVAHVLQPVLMMARAHVSALLK